MSMERRRRLRTRGLAAFAAVLLVSISIPAAASAQGNIVDDLLKGLGLGGSGGGGGAAEPAAGVPPSYTPPLHGANPHGQGDVAAVDLIPSDTLPLPGNPSDADEDLVIGTSKGQETNGSYSGRVTILHANLLGIIDTDALGLHDLLNIETSEGQTETGPTAALNNALDTIVCPALGGPGCLALLPMSSETTATGSQNSFAVASTDLSVDLGLIPVIGPSLGVLGLQSAAASSTGEISETSTCQTSKGTSNVADLDAGLPGIGPVSADALQGSSESQACNTGTSSVNQSSSVVNLQGAGLGIPVAGCANGTPNSDFNLELLGVVLASTVCNADTTNGGQTSSPYGVREALTIFALPALRLLKVTTAGPESHAVAPAATTPPDTPGTPGNGGGGNEGEGGGGGNNGNPGGGPTSTVAQPGGGELAFTGSNLLILGLMGAALILGGVGLARASTRRHQRLAA